MAFFDPVHWNVCREQGEKTREREAADRAEKRRLAIEQDVRHAVGVLLDARQDGHRSAHLGTLSEFATDCIVAPPEIYPQDWVDAGRLMGAWGQLRDEVAAVGVRLVLHPRVEGQTCNSRHWVFDIVAQW